MNKPDNKKIYLTIFVEKKNFKEKKKTQKLRN